MLENPATNVQSSPKATNEQTTHITLIPTMQRMPHYSSMPSLPTAEAALGIDLGTTKSCVAVFRKGMVEIIPNEQGNRITPSCAAFSDSLGFLVGEAAMSQLSKNPNNTMCGKFCGDERSFTPTNNITFSDIQFCTPLLILIQL